MIMTPEQKETKALKKVKRTNLIKAILSAGRGAKGIHNVTHFILETMTDAQLVRLATKMMKELE
jgi:hypothetical protein